MSEDRDFEAEARSEGWVPQEEWKGNPDNWVDAETFVKNGEQILPIVNAKNRKLSEQVEQLNQRVEQLSHSNSELKEFSQRALEKERQEKAQLIKDLEEARAKAVAEGDSEAFTRTDRQLNEVRSQPDSAKPNENRQQLEQELRSWQQENQWYGTDEVLTALVDGYAERVSSEKPWLKGAAYMEELKARAQQAMPDKFENPNRQKQTVEDEGKRGSKTGGRTVDDLPDDAKAALAKFKRDIPNFTDEDYLKFYDWEAE